MPKKWTAEELATLPKTEAVFNKTPLEFAQHQWQQQGYMISDVCNPSTVACVNVGIPIPSGKMLVKKNGEYAIVDERRSE